jgi:hypothetical protein
MKTLNACPALAQRHRAAVADAERAAASALAFAKLGRLRGADPAQPMPAGRLEFWPATQVWGCRIMLVRDAGTQTLSEADVRQVWPVLPGDDHGV